MLKRWMILAMGAFIGALIVFSPAASILANYGEVGGLHQGNHSGIQTHHNPDGTVTAILPAFTSGDGKADTTLYADGQKFTGYVFENGLVYPNESRWYVQYYSDTTGARGWVEVDISSIPNGSEINSLTLYVRISDATSYTMNVYIRHMDGQPSTVGGNGTYCGWIYGDIGDGTIYATVYNFGSSTGWKSYGLSSSACEDFEDRLSDGWFAVGFHPYSGDESFFNRVKLYPWVSDSRPYLEVNYTPADIHDVRVDSILSPSDTVTIGSEVTPQGVVKNGGDYEETFEVICKIDSSGVEVYADTASVNSLKPDSSRQVSFDPWTPRGEDITYQVIFWTALASDENPSNDTLSREIFSTTVGIKGGTDQGELPKAAYLYQNYPNPFNSTTLIRYHLSADRGRPTAVILKVYNILGQEVKTLVDAHQRPDFYTVHWDGRDNQGNEVPSGIYLYRLKAEGYSATRPMMLLR